MTQEDKNLLLKDLCSRLPYGVIIQEYNEEYGYVDNALNTIGIGYFSIHEACIEGTWINHIENVKPYLRPLSSMSEKEKEEYYTIIIRSQGCSFENGESATTTVNDWLLSKHFDVRGLISKGLAIAVTKENNPYKD